MHCLSLGFFSFSQHLTNIRRYPATVISLLQVILGFGREPSRIELRVIVFGCCLSSAHLLIVDIGVERLLGFLRIG